MPYWFWLKRPHQRLEANGEVFYFLFDRIQPDELHITVRHGVSPRDAVEAFFEGDATWNKERERFETLTAARGVYWARLPEDQGVVIISCFRTGEE